MPLDWDALTSSLAALGAIVFILWALLFVVRRLRPGAISGNARDLAVLRSLALGPRERLLVVRVGQRHLVVGVGAASVSLLCELDGPLPSPNSGERGFGDAVKQAVERWRAGS
jgi:flagellar protein FliO/FliZ